MADQKISELDAITVDRAVDLLPIVDTSDSQTKQGTVNSILGFSSGNPVSTSDSQTITNKVISASTITVADNVLTIQDNSDATKQMQFQLSGITTGNTRTLTIPNASTTIVGTDATQTLTNKTLTSPTINTGTIANPTLTIDTISEHTGANGVTVDSLNIKDGKLNTNNSVVTANVTDAAITPNKLVASTGTGWARQSWSPTWSGLTVGNGTVSAYYMQHGKDVLCRLRLTTGSTSSVSGNVTFTLPVTAISEYDTARRYIAGKVIFADVGTGVHHGIVRLDSTTTATLMAETAGATYVSALALSSTVPFTWDGTNADYLTAEFFYEAA